MSITCCFDRGREKLTNGSPSHEIRGTAGPVASESRLDERTRAVLPTTSKLAPLPLGPIEENPLVSVLVTSYNYARYLPAALKSVSQQTYRNLQAIVCDDGSSDDSVAVIKRHAESDARFQVICKENGGQSSALNAAYARAQGSIICLLDSDDEFCPRKIEAVVSAFRERPNAGLCIHKILPVSRRGWTLETPYPITLDDGWVAQKGLRRGGRCEAPPTLGISLRKEIAEQLFPIPERFRWSPDASLVMRAQFLTEIVAIPEVLAKHRLHGGNLSISLRPEVVTVRRSLEDIRQFFEETKAFVADRWGQETAAAIRLEDCELYWLTLLALYVVEGSGNGKVQGYPVEQVLANLPESKRKRLWEQLLRLPPSLAQGGLALWMGAYPGKGLIRWLAMRLTGWLGIR